VTLRLIAVPSALFLLSGAAKLVGHPRSLEMRDHVRVPSAAWRAIGATEVCAAGGLLLGQGSPRLARAGTIWLTAISLGAIASHVRVGDPAHRAAPAVGALALCVIVLAGEVRR
jgi:hypothetical protein